MPRHKTEAQLRQRAVNWAYTKLGEEDLDPAFALQIVKCVLGTVLTGHQQKKTPEATATALDRLREMKSA